MTQHEQNILSKNAYDEKQKLYNMNMQRLIEIRQQKDTQVPTVRLAPVKEEPVARVDVEVVEQPLADANVVENLPITMQRRATSLLACLREKTEMVTWDKSGEVKIRDEATPNSNITNLVSDAMRLRKHYQK